MSLQEFLNKKQQETESGSEQSFESFLKENNIQDDKEPDPWGVDTPTTTDAFSLSDDKNPWDEGGDASVLQKKLTANLHRKIADTETVKEENSMIFEFICNHTYNRYKFCMNLFKESNEPLHQRAGELYKKVYKSAYADAKAWGCDSETMKSKGEYLKVSAAAKSKFTGDGYHTCMLHTFVDLIEAFLDTIEVYQRKYSNERDEAQKKKGLFNRDECNEEMERCTNLINGWEETKELVDSWWVDVLEAYKLVHNYKPDDYFA
jgi:hypothetical protein